MLDMTCTNCEAPESLRAGQALELRGWDSSYKAALEFVPTRYVPPLLASSASIEELLAGLQWRTANAEGLTVAVQRYLTIHNRTHSALSTVAVATLQYINRQVMAVPWAGSGGTGMGMGCRYLIDFSNTKAVVEGRYLFARLIKQILIQIHNLPAPLEVMTRDLHGKIIHVE
jgi:type VI protein secretion system component VasA